MSGVPGPQQAGLWEKLGPTYLPYSGAGRMPYHDGRDPIRSADFPVRPAVIEDGENL